MLLKRDPPIDWQSIILDFRRWGWTLKGVARATNVPHSTILGWCNDGHPPKNFEDARAVLKLHAQVKATFEKRQADEKRRGDPVMA